MKYLTHNYPIFNQNFRRHPAKLTMDMRKKYKITTCASVNTAGGTMNNKVQCNLYKWGGRAVESPDTSPFPGYTCAKMAKYFRIFLPFNRTNYENSLFNGFIP